MIKREPNSATKPNEMEALRLFSVDSLVGSFSV